MKRFVIFGALVALQIGCGGPGPNQNDSGTTSTTGSGSQCEPNYVCGSYCGVLTDPSCGAVDCGECGYGFACSRNKCGDPRCLPSPAALDACRQSNTPAVRAYGSECPTNYWLDDQAGLLTPTEKDRCSANGSVYCCQ